MKSNNAALQLAGFSLQPAAVMPKYPFVCTVSTAFLLFISLVSFSREFKRSTIALPANATGAAILKDASSPIKESIRVNLYLLNDNGATKLADGALAEYNNSYHDYVTLEDIYKFSNINENLGIIRYGTTLAVERRPVIFATDTLFFKLWNTTKRDYQFELIANHLNHPGMQAFLEDNFLGVRTMLLLNGSVKINFSVNADAASANANRFRIVYQTANALAPLPVSFSSVKAYRLQNKISITWEVQNEINMESYEVERSSIGMDFSKVYAIARLNAGIGSYAWMDDHPLNGDNFYRIKAVDRDGTKKTSQIVKVTAGKALAPSIAIYPNPIIANRVNLVFANQPAGAYQLSILNINGQVVYTRRLTVSSGNTSQALYPDKKLATGIYQLELTKPCNVVERTKAIVQQ